jgi:NAD(P)-dependent dehydrogenase (short-subunit alcohol dehydrogenase family)
MPTVTIDHPRVVVVTGGSGGIGGETARRLARDGMAIVVAYAGRKAPAEEVVTAIIEAGGMATSFQAGSRRGCAGHRSGGWDDQGNAPIPGPHRPRRRRGRNGQPSG